MERHRGMPSVRLCTSLNSEGLEALRIGKRHLSASSSADGLTAFVAPVDTYATRLLAQALSPTTPLHTTWAQQLRF
jgi:hypothetical protein